MINIVRPLTDGPRDRVSLQPELLFELLDDFKAVQSGAVHLVDKLRAYE